MLAQREHGAKSHAMLPNPALENLTGGQFPANQSKILLHGDDSGGLTLDTGRVLGDEQISNKMTLEQMKKFDSQASLSLKGTESALKLDKVQETQEKDEDEEEKEE